TVTGQVHAFLMTPIMPVHVARLVINPSLIQGGAQNGVGTVTLNKPAPPGGISVNLDSYDSSVVQVPPTVLVPTGSLSATFNIATSRVLKAASITVMAGLGKTMHVRMGITP
ncbi:MAG TPA: hypothetical protein VKT32_16575, partial [Chthonomonadaceae bacterium]|nr:hypothetical protein [Chthonomonadaceae bacterium]